MSFHKEDGVSSLCQKALHIVTELCFAGQVEWEKCSGIFPPDRGSQSGGSTGNRGSLVFALLGPRALALSSRVLILVRRARGIFRAQRLPTSILPLTQPLATSSVGCSGWVSTCLPAGLLLCFLPAGFFCSWRLHPVSLRSPTPLVYLLE